MKKLLIRLKQPRWRHGKFSALLMVVFLLSCALLNVGLQRLEEANGWRRDMSFNSYATTGAETADVLSRLYNDVELYLLYQSGAIDAQLLALLKRYEVLSPHVCVIETDLNQNPGILTRFVGDSEHAVEADTVIVNCPATGRYKLLNYGDFMTSSYRVETGTFELTGLAYEKQLTESILFTAQSRIPTIGIMQGHGELDEKALAVMLSFLRSNNYDSTTVDLLKGDTLDEVDLLLFAAPQKDLTERELEAVYGFVQNGGSLFVLRDYTDPMEQMPNYLSLLHSYGVRPIPGVAVAGQEDIGSYYGEPLYLIPYMETLDMTMSLVNNGMDVLLMPASSAFETPAEPTGSLTTAVVLKTGANGYVRNLADGTDGIELQPGDRQGEIPVALFAHRMYANGNVSRLFAAGCSAAFIREYIYQRAYSQEFLLAVLGELLPDTTVSLDIMASAALRPALTVGSRTVGIALIVSAPLLILIVGLCVLLPRRSR